VATDKPHQNGKQFFEVVEKAIAAGEGLSGQNVVHLFDTAANHVAVLLGDAVETFRRSSYGTSVFLSITAMEETAKAEILGFRVQRSDKKGGRDPLRDHGQKHIIAVRPTTFMGRLPSILGEEVCARLQSEAESGGFIELREKALYVHAGTDGITSPFDAITRPRAKEILLLALECADDIVVGSTNRSFELGNQFEAWIREIQTLGD
jgi:AbiV family abortive infection protein